MTHPITPREKVAAAIDREALLTDSDGCVANPTRRDNALAAADRTITALQAEQKGGA